MFDHRSADEEEDKHSSLYLSSDVNTHVNDDLCSFFAVKTSFIPSNSSLPEACDSDDATVILHRIPPLYSSHTHIPIHPNSLSRKQAFRPESSSESFVWSIRVEARRSTNYTTPSLRVRQRKSIQRWTMCHLDFGIETHTNSYSH